MTPDKIKIIEKHLGISFGEFHGQISEAMEEYAKLNDERIENILGLLWDRAVASKNINRFLNNGEYRKAAIETAKTSLKA